MWPPSAACRSRYAKANEATWLFYKQQVEAELINEAFASRNLSVAWRVCRRFSLRGVGPKIHSYRRPYVCRPELDAIKMHLGAVIVEGGCGVVDVPAFDLFADALADECQELQQMLKRAREQAKDICLVPASILSTVVLKFDSAGSAALQCKFLQNALGAADWAWAYNLNQPLLVTQREEAAIPAANPMRAMPAMLGGKLLVQFVLRKFVV